jgi:diphosphomevalonate decarboxylase
MMNQAIKGDTMFWFAHAPANIALIKYMGKKDSTNIPTNASLSYTLDSLLSTVQLEKQAGTTDYWEPLNIPGAEPFTLSLPAQQRFLNHLAWLKSQFNYSGGFIVRSSNNFPLSSGLASSASSFAALTKCTVTALSELTNLPLPSTAEQAALSRQGSGSSCRSFFAPWALWREENVQTVEFPYQQLLHQVILVDHSEKKVSSSEAHARVRSSIHYAGRSERAETNLKLLEAALTVQDWANAYSICWAEFQDMHNLFSTCEKPFSYITEDSKALLRALEDFWLVKGDGPIVTMDAGPNIHLLYRMDQSNLAREFKQDYLIGNYDVL